MMKLKEESNARESIIGRPDESLGSLGARAAKKLRSEVRKRQDRIHASPSNLRAGWYYDFQNKPEAFWSSSVSKGTSRSDK
jgi:hypothetical protein